MKTSRGVVFTLGCGKGDVDEQSFPKDHCALRWMPAPTHHYGRSCRRLKRDYIIHVSSIDPTFVLWHIFEIPRDLSYQPESSGRWQNRWTGLRQDTNP